MTMHPVIPERLSMTPQTHINGTAFHPCGTAGGVER